MGAPLDADLEPVTTGEPEGFMVTVEPGDRIHFLDWGRDATRPSPGLLLVHGLSQTAWIWTPVVRRTAHRCHVVAMDLRGHGLSDAPTEDGAYDPGVLADDVVAVAEGAALLGAAAGERFVLAGHGFGAVVAAWAAVALGERCAGLVLVDGGWERIEDVAGMDVDEFLRGLAEPPEVMRSMAAFLRDRRGFDPATWDEDQRRAAAATVVETRAGRLVPATRPDALEACVRTMFRYDPIATLPAVTAPIVALVAAADDTAPTRSAALATASAAREAAGRDAVESVTFDGIGHNLMRYRPQEVSKAILGVVERSARS
jgi:pimeloyl-ACP methyl ester carboxylesterase